MASPPGARLAIGTAAGMELWSTGTGIYPLGPTLDGAVVSDIAWSSDGRYLSWQTTPAAGGRRRGTELWWSQVSTGLTTHWGPRAGGFGPVVVTAVGVRTLHAAVVLYPARTAAAGGPVTPRTVAVPTASPAPGTAVQSWTGGWVLEPSGSPTGQRVERVAVDGAAVDPEVVFDAGTSHGPSFSLEAVDPAGTVLAAGLGTHRAGCETSGVAQLWTAALTTGTVRYTTPPAPGARRTQRFWWIGAGGPSGTVYASTFACTPAGRAAGTVLWRLASGRWTRLGRDEVAAARVAGTPLATLSGTVGVSHGVAAVTGPGDVAVGGRTVASGGQAIAWDPVVSPAGVS